MPACPHPSVLQFVQPRAGGALAGAAWRALRPTGWRVVLAEAVPMRCAIVFRPHTSNRDFPSRLFAKWVVGIRFRWVGKDTLFNNPLRSLFIRWDGIPVNRRERTGFIEQMRHAFEDSEDFRLVVAPEGTRRRTAHWKSGFHRRAEAAAVPVELGFTDTKPREIGIGGFVDLGGDPDADLEAIAAFHSDTHGRRSQNARPVRLP